MPFPKGHHPGATWRKADLQCHSPRDRAWTDPPRLPGGIQELEAARAAWADSFIRECNARNIELVAITDHHDMTFVPYVVASAVIEGGVTVLPGVEVTCADSAQCLVFIDPSCPQTTWTHLLGKLKGVSQAPANDEKTAETVVANMTILDFVEAVSSDKVLRDHCVIIPHFSDGTAHKHLNVQGHHERFASIACDGVYIEKPYSELEAGTLDKVRGNIEAWGKRRRAIIATGDNRSPTWDRLGAHECWVKLGEDTIEALRQALLADEARIAHETPELPTERIIELRVRSSLTGPDVFSISLNEGFTAIIGGRGSGKSSLLEYLRFGLGRMTKDVERADEDDYDRAAELIDDTLDPDGLVEVIIEREGLRETWQRTFQDRDTITVTTEDDQLELSIEDAQRRFRARAFPQKGLSTTMNNPLRASEQITGIAAAEQLDRRRRIDNDIDTAKRAIGTAIRNQTAFWKVQLDRRRAQGTITDLHKRLQALSQRLEKEGVSKETMDVLGQSTIYERAKGFQTLANRVRVTDTERLLALKNNFLSARISSFAGAEAFEEIRDLDEALIIARNNVMKHIDAAMADLNTLGEVYSSSLQAFEKRNTVFQVQLQQAVAAQTAHKQLLAERARLSEELAEAEAEEMRIAEEVESKKAAPAEFNAACRHLDTLLNERVRVLSEAAHKVETQSSGLLKAKHLSDPEPAEYVAAMVKLLNGCRIHDVEPKSIERVQEFSAFNAPMTWAQFRDKLLRYYRTKIMTGLPVEIGEPTVTELRGTVFSSSTLTDQQVQRVFQNLDDDRLSEICAATPRDQIALTYVDGGKGIPFAKASPGQQASALLELLLSQSAGTLIIDQPEDDLDNKIIMKIVSLIRRSKDRRQLLFSTHNPNIVVNGDADKVIALKSGEGEQDDDSVPRIQIDIDGAIETPAIRTAITAIMEGGRDAFDLRNRKYNFDTMGD
ncbi:TrlF family AAA-like ATPase [Bradyrhizobium stylosanthis]